MCVCVCVCVCVLRAFDVVRHASKCPEVLHGWGQVPIPPASERRGDNSEVFKGVDVNDQAIIWPLLSYVGTIYSKSDPRSRRHPSTPESWKGSPKVNFPSRQWLLEVETCTGACFE